MVGPYLMSLRAYFGGNGVFFGGGGEVGVSSVADPNVYCSDPHLDSAPVLDP